MGLFDNHTKSKIDRRKPLADLVFEAIRDNILSGQIKADDWLRQEDVASELGVSHTPVRQALERLIAEGLAERVPYKGVRVSHFKPEEIAEIYALRLLLKRERVQS